MISVVVPVFNMYRYLNRCVESLLDQSYSDFEILLVDDGSTDGSGELCDRMAESHPRIIKAIHHEQNKGLSATRNTGIELARGEFIIFPDPDDWVEPDYLEKLISLYEQYGSDIEMCTYTPFKEKEPSSHTYMQTPMGRNKNETFKSSVLMTAEDAIKTVFMPIKRVDGNAWDKLFHMDIIRKNGLHFETEAKRGQDLLFCYMYLKCCKYASLIRKELYHYNNSSGTWSDMKKYDPQKMTVFTKVLEPILSFEENSNSHEVSNLVKSQIVVVSVNELYRCHRINYKDEETIKYLNNNIVKYKKYFFDNKYNAPRRRLAIRLFTFNQWLYHCARTMFSIVQNIRF